MTILQRQFLEKTKKKVIETLNLFEEMNLDKNTFCVMPFVNIILEPNGDVGICRQKGTSFTFGNIQNQSIDEIWSSQKIQEWRQGHLDGTPKICEVELVDRKCNLCPELNALLPNAEIDNIKNPKILRLTANLNGKCNLQCQMCNVWKMPNGFYTEENFWIPAKTKFFKDILEVDMLSGEPFIQPDTYRLINEVSAVNPNCQWTFTTNLHWRLTDKIKSSLDKIIIKNIIVSIDSLNPDVYSKIRKLGDLKFVLKNIDELIKYQEMRIEASKSGLQIRLNFLTQKDNWFELKEIIQFCLNKKIIPFITLLHDPLDFSILNLDHEERIKILNFYFQTLNREELLLTQRVLKPLIRSLDKINYVSFMMLLNDRMIQKDE